MATSFFGGSFFGGEFFNSSPTPPAATGGSTIISFQASKGIDWAEVERIKLEKLLAKKRRELKKVEKQVKVAEKKADKSAKPAGILANLHLLEAKADKLSVEIAELEINLTGILDFLGKLDFGDDDDEDVLLLL